VPTGEIGSVVIFGAGNLASHLAMALRKLNLNILQIYNRTDWKGKKLALKTGAEYLSRFDQITPDADLYIFALADSFLPEIVSKIRISGKLVVHTSGSHDMQILEPVSERYGVFYPLQTFISGSKRSFRKIPVCIETNRLNDLQLLTGLGQKLSGSVFLLNSEQRGWLHLASVYAGNFSHFMYVIAADLLRDKEVPFELVKPLIGQVTKNALHNRLFPYLTGPAIREDKNILERHQAQLAQNPDYLEIYNLISKSIIRYKKQHGKL